MSNFYKYIIVTALPVHRGYKFQNTGWSGFEFEFGCGCGFPGFGLIFLVGKSTQTSVYILLCIPSRQELLPDSSNEWSIDPYNFAPWHSHFLRLRPVLAVPENQTKKNSYLG